MPRLITLTQQIAMDEPARAEDQQSLWSFSGLAVYFFWYTDLTNTPGYQSQTMTAFQVQATIR